VYYRNTKTFSEGADTATVCMAQINGNPVPRKDYARVQALLSELKAVFPFAVSTIETLDVARAAACSRCGKAFTESDVQYLSVFQAKFVLCEACEATPGEGQGSAGVAHPYSMYRIHPGAERLDELLPRYLEKDTQYDVEPEIRFQGASCKHCDSFIDGVLWSCVQCPDLKLCDSCHSRWTSAPSDSDVARAAETDHAAWHISIKKPFPN
jgi:hypothetical protein